MEAYRVRIIKPDGSISVLDKTFSQVVELIKDLPRNRKDAFWNKQEVVSNGHKILFVREV